MKKKLLLYLLTFLLIGEVVLRFDAATLFFQGSRFQQLENQAKVTSLSTAVAEQRFEPRPDQFRILLLGDSFLYQGSWPDDVAFAPVLRDLLQEGPIGADREILVLDQFVPGAGPDQERERYLEFADVFHPDLVFWAYNRNDVMQVKPAPPPAEAKESEQREQRQRRGEGGRARKGFLAGGSKVLFYLKNNLTRELKSHGIVLPGSRFSFIIHRSHDPANPSWQLTQDVVEDVESACSGNGTKLFIMITPLLDALPYYDLVSDMDSEMVAVFTGIGAEVMNGADPFLADPGGDYSISAYDEHPNAKAHRILAGAVAQRIVEMYSK